MNSPNPSFITVPTQKVIWKVVATNNGMVSALPNVKVVLAWSTAPVYHRLSSVTDSSGIVFGDGSANGTFFDIATNTWQVGTLAVGQTKTLYVETSLSGATDLSTALPLTLTKTISLPGLTDSDTGNNVSIDVLNAASAVVECAPVAGNTNGIACRCSLMEYTTPCNYGITTWELIPGSFVNTTEVGLDLDPATGYFTKFLLDPTIPGTFQFRVICTVGEDNYGPFGTATVTIPALYGSIDGIVNVANFAALPAANTATGRYYFALTEQGSGASHRQNGLYYSNGSTWVPGPGFIANSFTELYLNDNFHATATPTVTLAQQLLTYQSKITVAADTSGDVATGLVTILKAGVYRVEFLISGTASLDDVLTYTVKKGVTDLRYTQVQYKTNLDTNTGIISFTDTFAVNDIIRVYSATTTEATLNLNLSQKLLRVTRVA